MVFLKSTMKTGRKLVYLQVELLCLQLSFYWACSPFGCSESHTIGAIIFSLHNVIVSNSCLRLCNRYLYYRSGFELFPRLCNLLRCYKHTRWALDYITKLFLN